jgi:phospholipid-binding lipoprotein MlaA
VLILASAALLCAGCANSKAKAPDTSQASLNASQDDEADGDFDFMEEEFQEKIIEIADPLEGVNRLMFGVNDALYFWVLKPVTEVYVGITDEPTRISVGNFFNNLSTPLRYVSCLIQGKGERADIELRRLFINSTEGILGFGDPAKEKHGLEVPPPEDLGQSLAVMGVGDGLYLVLPLIGPSTARDAVGKAGGLFLSPIFYVDPHEAALGIGAGKYTNILSFRIGDYESFKEDSIDPYVAMREIYIQYRKKQIEE